MDSKEEVSLHYWANQFKVLLLMYKNIPKTKQNKNLKISTAISFHVAFPEVFSVSYLASYSFLYPTLLFFPI